MKLYTFNLILRKLSRELAAEFFRTIRNPELLPWILPAVVFVLTDTYGVSPETPRNWPETLRLVSAYYGNPTVRPA